MSSRQVRRVVGQVEIIPNWQDPNSSDEGSDWDEDDGAPLQNAYDALYVEPLSDQVQNSEDEAEAVPEPQPETQAEQPAEHQAEQAEHQAEHHAEHHAEPLAELLAEQQPEPKAEPEPKREVPQPKPQPSRKSSRRRRRRNRRRRSTVEDANPGPSTSNDTAQQGDPGESGDNDADPAQEPQGDGDGDGNGHGEGETKEDNKDDVDLPEDDDDDDEYEYITVTLVWLISEEEVENEDAPADNAQCQQVGMDVVEITDFADYLLTVNLDNLLITSKLRQMMSGNELRYKPSVRARVLQRSMLIEYPEDLLAPNRRSLFMTVQVDERGERYFTFNHTIEYQKMQRALLASMNQVNNVNNMNDIPTLSLNLETSLRNRHVEALLEIFDTMYRENQYFEAQELLQKILSILQYSTISAFDLSDRRTYLPYKILENRPFYAATMKMMYLLLRKGIHDKALEICKMLINLDPEDPMAMIIIVDGLALKARRYEWLLGLLDYWTRVRSAGLMFNVLYSHALAYFNCVKKSRNPNDKQFADDLIKNAIISYPYVVTLLLKDVNDPSIQHVKDSAMFGPFAVTNTACDLRQLMKFYVRNIGDLWTDRSVLPWLLHNAEGLARAFDIDITVQRMVFVLGQHYKRLFQQMPDEIVRHLRVAEAMSEQPEEIVRLLGPRRPTSFDPLPSDDEVDRYGYFVQVPAIWQPNWPVIRYVEFEPKPPRHHRRGHGNRQPFASGASYEEARKVIHRAPRQPAPYPKLN